MLAPERQKFILDELSKEGAVTVSRLALSLSVTEETIRRDLEKLEKSESLRRTHPDFSRKKAARKLKRAPSFRMHRKQRPCSWAHTEVS